MKMARILSWVVGLGIALVAVLLLSVWLFVNPNHYKPRIVAAVKQATGRDLALGGDIKLTVFPWLALEVGPAILSNPPGFGSEPFVSFKRASLRAKLLPLLAGRLEIGRVELDGLEARLLTNAAGKGNWEGLSKADAKTPAAKSGSGETFADLAGVKISNSRLSYNQYALENLNVQIGAFASNARVPVALSFDVNRGVSNEHANFQANLDFNADLGARQYHIAALALHGTVNRPEEEQPIRWDVTTPTVDVDLAAQTLNAPTLSVDLAGARLTGSLRGTHIVDALALSGKAALEPLVVREFLPRLGMAVPKTRDPKALSLVAASFGFGYDPHGARLDDLEVTLDDTHLKGHAATGDLQQPKLEFAMAVDRIDLDRYLPPPAPKGEPDAAGTRAAAETKTPGAKATAEPKAKPLDANGVLTVGSVHVGPLDLTAVSLTLAAADGVVHLYPLTAKIDGGEYSGHIVYDARESVPSISLDEHLTGIEVGKLVNTSSRTMHISGHGNVNLKATGRGAESATLMKSLNGHFDAAIMNGAVEGIDVGFQLARAEALLRRQDPSSVKDTGRTVFVALKLSAAITDGVAQTKDLSLVSPILKVTGDGSLNLATQILDFSLLADTLHMAGNTPIRLPLKVTGAAADPTVRPDLDALAKGAIKQKVQDAVTDKLKGLFNR